MVEKILEKSSDPEICEDIYENIRKTEMAIDVEKLRENVVYLRRRSMLVNWLVEVAERFQLLSETLHLTVFYMDRFSSTNVIERQKIWVMGVSSMLIAAKYEEINPRPDAEDLALEIPFRDLIVTQQDVVKMEADVLKALKYEIGYPTATPFVRRLTKVALEGLETPSLRLELLGLYLAELSLLENRCIKYLPSKVAASATFLARFTLKPGSHPWNLSLEQLSGYKPSDLKDCVMMLHDLQLSRQFLYLDAIRKKYMRRKFKRVSKLPSPSVIPVSFFENPPTSE